MSKAQIGTAYTPTLVGKLAESAGRDLLPEWRKAKETAYKRGMEVGAGMIGTAIRAEWTIPYLQYIYLLGIAQAIANHGRDIAEIGGKHDLDPQKKGQK